MMDRKLIEIFNFIYDEYGFYAVIDEVKDRLKYGMVTDTNDGLYRITTGGYSEDETILHSLIHLLSRFGHNHYVGYLRGGAFYFSTEKHDIDIAIVRIKREELK